MPLAPNTGMRPRAPAMHPEFVDAVWGAGFSPLGRCEVQRAGDLRGTVAMTKAKRRERRAPSLTTRGCPRAPVPPTFGLDLFDWDVTNKSVMRSPPPGYRRGDAAFTLIELLVVMAIIAILAALLLTALRSAKDHTYIVNDLNNIRQILMAAHLFASDHNDYMPYCGWGGLPDRDCCAYSKDLARYP